MNVFTYSTLNATLRAPLQSSTSLGGATCCYSFLYVPELVYLLPVLHASNKMSQVFHGTLVYVILPEFCPEFPLLLCIISGILDYLRIHSCLHLGKPMASSSSMYINYHCSTVSYFISLSDIERGVQCKITETKAKEVMKTLSSSMQWHCFVHRQPCQHKGSEVCSH